MSEIEENICKIISDYIIEVSDEYYKKYDSIECENNQVKMYYKEQKDIVDLEYMIDQIIRDYRYAMFNIPECYEKNSLIKYREQCNFLANLKKEFRKDLIFFENNCVEIL